MRNTKRNCLAFLHVGLLYITKAIPRNRKTMIFGAWFGEKYDDNSKANKS